MYVPIISHVHTTFVYSIWAIERWFTTISLDFSPNDLSAQLVRVRIFTRFCCFTPYFVFFPVDFAVYSWNTISESHNRTRNLQQIARIASKKLFFRSPNSGNPRWNELISTYVVYSRNGKFTKRLALDFGVFTGGLQEFSAVARSRSISPRWWPTWIRFSGITDMECENLLSVK